MRVLVVNAGSSTLKLQVVEGDDSVSFDESLDSWSGDEEDARGAIERAISGGGNGVDAVGHRVVHGGRDFTEPTRATDEVERELSALTDLAPLHQPRALAGLRAARSVLPGVDHVACFDTAFHSTMPHTARTYALPGPWRERWGLERFGFHGLSHAWVAQQAPAIAGLAAPAQIVSCHLGAGASLCAIADGCSVDTTMGFTPLEGVVMATRSGSVDPGLILWLLEHGGMEVADLTQGLEKQSGLAGLSGTTGDMRDVLRARGVGDASACLAFDVYVHRLRQGVAAMVASLGGLDLLAFTGGVGEHAAEVRAAAVEGLAFLGVAVDEGINRRTEVDGDLSTPDAAVRTVVVTAREDLEIAHQVRTLLTS